ncbi:hypothetical protein [Pseudoxanthomonas sp. 10H]|uniref:hypothetical protein n=1 Tax=Pseudoxanthomonas sp. 10H TaxID=3242729 RepID=UPI003555C799
MSLLQAMKLLIVASIVLNVLALAMRAHAQDVVHLVRNWRLGLRAFVAMFVLVPAIAVAMVAAFELRPEVEIALLVLSLSPVPPLLPRKQLKAGGEGSYITGLLVAAALASLLVLPLGLHLMGMLFEVGHRIPTASVARTLAITIGAPLLLGFAMRRLLGRARAIHVSNLLGRAGMALLLASGLVVLVAVAPAMWSLVGRGTLVALLAMIVAGLGAGYLMGSDVPENRAALALACATRHPGVAMGVIAAGFPDQRLAVVVVAMAVLLNVPAGIGFLRFIHRGGDASAVPR